MPNWSTLHLSLSQLVVLIYSTSPLTRLIRLCVVKEARDKVLTIRNKKNLFNLFDDDELPDAISVFGDDADEEEAEDIDTD